VPFCNNDRARNVTTATGPNFDRNAEVAAGPGCVEPCGECAAPSRYESKRLPEFMPDAPEKRKRKQPGRVTTSSAPLFAGPTLTPLQMLGVLLKIVLKNRVTDHEIDEICSTYYEAITNGSLSPLERNYGDVLSDSLSCLESGGIFKLVH
jgi:hypothetical protein